MVHIDLCTREGVMKAYAFRTPEQALSMIEKIKDDDFQWFNLDWEGRKFTCPKKFIKRMTSWSYIKLMRGFL